MLDELEDDRADPPASFGETGDGEEIKAGSETGIAKMVPYRSSRACATSACQFFRP